MDERQIVITFGDDDMKIKSVGTVSAAEIIMAVLLLLRNVDKDNLGAAIGFLQDGINQFKGVRNDEKC